MNDYVCPCPAHPMGCLGHPRICLCARDPGRYQATAVSTSPFQPVAGHVLLTSRGTWRAAALASYKGVLLALKRDKAYVRLYADGSTSVTGCRWLDIETDEAYETGLTGLLTLKEMRTT